MEEEGSDITDDLVDGYSEKHATEVENPKQVKPPRRLEMSTSRTIILSSVPGAFLDSHCSNCFELLFNDRFQCGLCNGGGFYLCASCVDRGVHRPRMGRGRHLSQDVKKGDKAEVTFSKEPGAGLGIQENHMTEEFQKSFQEREGLPGNYTGMTAGSEGQNRKDMLLEALTTLQHSRVRELLSDFEHVQRFDKLHLMI